VNLLFDSREEALEHQKKAIEDEMRKIDQKVCEKQNEIAQLLSNKDQMYVFLYKRDKKTV
jgi:hypothetical protein